MALRFLRDAYFVGKVGIGTATPSAKLEVVGQDVNFFSTTSNQRVKIGRFPTEMFDVYVDDSRIILTATQDSDSDGNHSYILDRQFAGTGDNNFEIRKSNSIQLLIDKDGNVGIGTTTPTAKLDVTGTIFQNALAGMDNYLRTNSINRASTSSLNPGILVYGSGTTSSNSNYGMDLGYNSTSAKYSTRIFTSSSQNISFGKMNGASTQSNFIELMTISSNSNVGIGTVTPNARLTIKGLSLTSEDLFHIEDSGGVRMIEIVTDPVGNASIQVKDTTGATKALLNSAGNTYFNGGNVGIGTTSPSELLTIAAESPTLRFEDISSSNYTEMYVNNFDTYLNTNGRFFIQNQGSTKVTFKSDGNVGIGTTSPTNKLEVISAANEEGIAIKDSSGNLKYKIRQFGGNSYSTFWDSSNTEKVKITSGGSSFFNGGNVGIGTTSPSESLHIEASDPRIKIVDTDGTNWESEVFTQGGALKLQARNGTNFGNISFQGNNGTAQSEYARFNSVGNFGIGTTSPSQKLDVEGNVIIRPLNTTDTISFLNLGSNQSRLVTTNNFAIFNGSIETARFLTTGGFKLAEYGSGTFTGTATQRLGVDTSGNVIEIPIGSGAVDGSGTANYTARWIDVDTLGIGSLYDDGTGIGVGTTTIYSNSINLNNSGTLRIGNAEFISKSSNDLSIYQGKIRVQQGGNVGIGTTSPSEKLEVSGYAKASIGFKAGNYTILNESGNETSLGNSAYYPMFFKTNNSVRMTISNSGNVGIGTTSPDKKLDLTVSASDDGLILQTSTGRKALEFLVDNGINGRGIINFYTSTSLLYGRINANSEGLVIDTIANRHMIFNKAGVEVMRINTSGNVGIGTTSPGVKLDVNGQIRSNDSFLLQSGTTAIGSIRNQAGALDIRGDSTRDISLGSVTNPQALFVEGTNGKVGIGTTTPARKLSIYEPTATNVYFQLANVTSGGGTSQGFEIFYGGVNASIVNRTTAGFIDFETGGDSSLKILGNGNVGIGTTSPGTILHVKGGSSGYLFRTQGSNTINIYDSGSSIGLGSGSGENLNLYANDSLNVGVEIITTGQTKLKQYGSGTFTGTAAYNLSVDSSGNIIETTAGGVGSSNWTLTGNNIYNNNSGNVGIGTASPTEKLEVIGKAIIRRTGTATAHSDTDLLVTDATAAGSTAQLEILGGNAGNSFLYFSDTDSYQQGGIQYQHSSDSMNFRVNASTAVSINSSRNVGIGTTTPLNRLQVSNGSVGIDFQYMIRDNRNNTILLQSPSTAASNRTLTIGNATYNNIIIPNGNVGIGTTSPSEKLHIAGGGSGNVRLDTGGTYYGTNFQAISSAGLKIGNDDFSGYAFFNNDGNIGIGTTTPTKDLEIGTSGVADSEFRMNSDTAGKYLDILSAGNFTSVKTTGSQNFILHSSGTSGYLTVVTNASERMRVNYNGNVGIGTTAPSAKLHLADSASGGNPSFILQDNARSGAAALNYILLTDSLNANQAKIGYLSGLNTDLTLQNLVGNTSLVSSSQIKITAGTNTLFENSGSEKMRILANGNVGIGTTNPTVDLQLGAFGSGNNEFRIESSGNSYFSVLTSNGTQKIYAGGAGTQSNEMAFYTSNAGTEGEIMRITSAGRVGIGTTGPISKFSVLGDSSSSNIPTIRVESSNSVSNIHFLTASTGSNAAADGFYVGVNGTTAYIINREPTSLYLGSNGDVVQTISGSGNVGIGVTNPGYKLEVNSGTSNNIAKFESSDGGGVITVRDSVGEVAFSNVGNDIYFKTSSSQTNQMSILNSGNVGIGTNSPDTKLEVAGTTPTLRLTDTRNLNVGDWDDVSLGKIEFKTSDTSSPGARVMSEIEAYSGPGAASAPESQLRFKTATNLDASATTKMTIAASGNVGIGTLNPSRLLDVDGIQGWSQGTNVEKAYLNPTGTGVDFKLAGDNGEIRFDSRAGSNSYISTGNVGIGTTNPGQKLHVVGEGKIQGNLMIGASGDIAGAVGQLHIKGPNAQTIVLEDTDNANLVVRLSAEETVGFKIEDTTHSNVLFFGDQSGNVGIGTSDPSSKLQVAGGVQMADDTDTASADKVGTQRYRADSNNSYVDMCMQTGATTYEWVNIVQNNW